MLGVGNGQVAAGRTAVSDADFLAPTDCLAATGFATTGFLATTGFAAAGVLAATTFAATGFLAATTSTATILFDSTDFLDADFLPGAFFLDPDFLISASFFAADFFFDPAISTPLKVNEIEQTTTALSTCRQMARSKSLQLKMQNTYAFMTHHLNLRGEHHSFTACLAQEDKTASNS